MDAAFTLAQEAFDAAEVPIGCVFVYNNRVIASGRNEVTSEHTNNRKAVDQ